MPTSVRSSRRSNHRSRRFVSRHPVLLITLVLMAALLAATIGGPVADAVAPNFAAKQDFATGTNPYSVAVGDLNGDGQLDLAGANLSNNNASVLLHDTDGAPTVVSATTGDSNSNGKIDRITVVYSEAVNDPEYDAVAVMGYTMLGTGSGSGTDTLVYNLNEGASALDESFRYTSGTYCQSGPQTTPIVTGTPGGTFESTPAGLSINPSTGTINLPTSTLGTYTITYDTTGGANPNRYSISMTIANTDPSATFSYSIPSFGQNETNPLPIFVPGASAGAFTASPGGLVFANINTGEINLAVSAPGTYTVTNTIPISGTCSSAIATTSVTITPAALPPPAGAFDTGATPALTWIAANAANLAGDPLDTSGAPTNATDGANPVLLSFTSTTANGTYGPGSNINITATYSENISSGSITVNLNNTVTGLVLSTASSNTISGTYVVGATGSGQDITGLDVSAITAHSAVDAASNTDTATTMPGTTIVPAHSININTTPPTLGNYPDTSIALSGDTTVTPSATPANGTSINVSTSTSFNGELTADVATGVVRVTNAHPANIPHVGSYLVTVKATGPGGSTTQTFTLTVTDGPACAGTPGFTNAADVSVGSSPFAVAIGDFNNDGKQDLAAANQNSNTVSIRLGDGLGGFSGTTEVSVGSFPRAVAIGDFNNDGKQDLAAANFSSGTVSIRLGDGLGGFSGTTEVSVGAHPRSVAIGDFNNDGNQDLATANEGSNTVSIRLGDGLGGFSGTTEVSVGSNPDGVAIGDFNNDDKQDLAAANFGSGTVSIRLGDGFGGFSSTTDVSVGISPSAVAIGDFNNDGNQDLAAANHSSSTVSIRLGNGSGGFSGTTDVSVGSSPSSVAIGDFNNDGKQDLAAANDGSGTVSIRLDGLGGFSGTTDVIVGGLPLSVAIGDFNNDGMQDIAAANANSDNVSVRLGQCNLPPTIAAATGLSRQQGSPVSNSQIATVTDDGGNGSVVVTVTSTNPSNGVTISSPVNAGGNITADIIADCTATTATFTLQASDGSSTATDTLTVTVTANSAPTLVYSTPQSVAFNGSLDVTPTTATDNGSITGYSVFSVSPALTTPPTVDSSGKVTITNAQPPGSHVITIQATDNCSATTNAAFTLNVPSPATMSGTKAVSGTFAPNGAITYTVVLSNSGPAAQLDNPGDEFSDVLPSGLTLVSASATSGTAVATVGSNTVTWNGSIPASSSVTITIHATINSNAGASTISNQGTISYDADGNGTNEASALTDDPSVGGASDATSFFACGNSIVVTANGNSGAGSLRQAILDACPGATITFDVTVTSPITVSSELVINKNLTIQGPTSSGLTISGNNASRVFNINSGANLAISNLTIDSGRAAFGGGIYNQGALILTSSTISNNKTTDGSDTTDATNGGNSGDGGGIYSTGTLTLINSTISGNKTGRGGDASGTGNGGGNSGNGAGIYHTGALTLTNTTVTKNQTGRVGAPVSPNTTGIPGSTVGTGGGIFRSGGTLILNNTIVADNRDGFSDPDDINGTVDSASASNLIGSSAGFNGISNGTNGNQIGQSAVPLSPQLAPLADNGGPTKTHLPQQLSPAIDAGSNALAKDQSNNPLTSDQRGPGFDRILNGTVEIGAVEVNYGPPGSSADVGVTKSSNPDSALANTNVTYTITVSNGGPNVATNATLTDTLPAAVTFVSLSSPGGWSCTTPAVGSGGIVSCTNASLPLTAGAVFTLVVHIIPGATPGNFITNQAQVATSAFDANNENDSSAASTLIVGANADLGVTKLASADTSPADRDVRYTITVTNGGPTAAANVALNDTLPGNMTFVSLSSPAGWSCASHPAVGAGGTVTCTNPSLAVTSGQVFTLVGHIPSGTSNGTFYFNQATVSSSTSDPNPDNNSSPAGTTVVACVTDPVVTTNADSGAGSLRQVIIDACDGSTINFDMTQVVSPITLTSAELAINKNLTIQGPGANLLTVQRSTAGGPPKFRIFNIQSGTVNISGLTISNGDNAANGGAITNLGALTLNGLTLSNNHTSADGSAIFNSSVGTVALSNSTLSGNQSDVLAAVYNQGGAFTITNSTLTGNTNVGSLPGVAIFSESNSATNVTNCTISKNIGPAEAVSRNGSGQVNLKNSIVSGNTGGDVSGITDNGNNLIGGNPLLAPLGNYGGPTQTMALLPGSPAINAGTSTGAPATDQRGISRVGAVDIGAFESRGFTISATSGNAQSTPILTAFGAPLVATVSSAFSEPVAAGMVIFTAPGSGASATFTGGVTTFNATINGGGQATATPTANGTAGGPYNVAATANGISSTATFSLTNQKSNQTITFGPLANKTFGDPDFGVSATASSGLPVSFAALGNCTVSGSTVHLTGGGSCTVTASQGGDSNYNAAANVPQSFTIAKGNQTITFGALVNKTFGDPDFGVSATASSGLAVSFAALGNCTVSGSTVHLTGGGSCTVTASQGGDSNYNAAANVPQSFTIAKAATTTALSASINPSDIGQNVTFTATVSAGVGTPTGTVQFKDGANNLGGAINCVAGGGNTCTAQVSISTLTTGTHTITAIYSGDTNFSGSTGALSGGQVVTNQQALLLILDQSGPDPNQAAAFDALLLLRDPFHVQSVASWWNFGPAPDRNTRVMVFVANLQLNPGETAAAVVVHLIDSNSLSYDVAAEDIRLDPITGFAQVTFRLPDTLFPGTCTLTVKAHGHVSNSATMRIAP